MNFSPSDKYVSKCTITDCHRHDSFHIFMGSRVGVVDCMTRNPWVLGLTPTGSSRFFSGRVFGQDTSESQPSTGETQEGTNNVSCGRDMTEILLKAV